MVKKQNMNLEEYRVTTHKYHNILNTEPEVAYNEIVELASLYCACPIANIALVDGPYLKFKASYGNSQKEILIEHAFCNDTLQQDGCFVVEDASQDQRFASNPFVAEYPYLRFYAGVPIVTPTGEKLGTLSVLDTNPGSLRPDQKRALMVLARQVFTQMELHKHLDAAKRLELIRQETEIQMRRQARMLNSLKTALTQWITDTSPHKLFSQLLAEILEHIECEYGFIGEVRKRADGSPYLKSYAVTDIAWNEETRQLYAKFQAEGLEFDNMNTIFGEVILSQRPLLTNDPANHPKSGGLPPGHPPLRAFLGMPLLHGGQIIGMIGLANHPGGFTHELMEFLEPFAATCSQIIAARQKELQRVQIINSALDAIISIDHNGIVINWNKQAEETFGWKREEAIGQRLSELVVPPEVRNTYRTVLGRYLTSQKRSLLNKRVETLAMTRSGERFPVELALTPIETGSQVIFNGFLRDIRDRKAAEQQLAAQTVKLSSALEQAEHASRLKSEFVASVSHEIRTPLNGVIGTTDLLLGTNLTPFQRELAVTLRQSAHTLLSLINDVLDFSKIEAGKLTIEQEPFDLLALLEDVLALSAPDCQGKAIPMLLKYSPGTPRHFMGDMGRIRQIILNLMSNAVKFTNTGHILITVSSTPSNASQHGDLTDSERCVRISVEDTGIGIAADKQVTIFDKFTQIDSSVTRRYGGTGLGLAISQQLAHLMGGTLRVDSQVGVGSTFTLELPLGIDKTRSSKPFATIGSYHILIVNPYPLVGSVLSETFTSWGLNPHSFLTLEEANLCLERNVVGSVERVDMMLIDSLALERATHFEVERFIRLVANRHIKILVSAPLCTHNQESILPSLPNLTHDLEYTRISVPLRLSELYQSLMNITTNTCQSTRETREEQAWADFTGVRILLAEDNPINQKLMVLILSKMGCEIDVAANGLEAIRMAENTTYDLIFMDCQMPEMDGYQATRRLRASTTPARDTPVIALTAHVMLGERDQCLAAGMNDYITKPISRAQIATLIQKWARQDDYQKTHRPVCVRVLETLQSRLGDENLVREFIAHYLAEWKELWQPLEAAVQRNSPGDIARDAHRLKGLLMALDISEALSYVERLEVLGKTNNVTQAPELLFELKKVMDAVRISFEHHYSAIS